MKEYICLGEIVGAHGIKGHVKIKTFTSKPESIGDYGSLVHTDTQKTFILKNIRIITPTTVVAAVDGICDRTTAESLIGLKLSIKRDQLPKVNDDEFYHEDLIGLHVRDDQEKDYGIVIGLEDYGAGVFLNVKSDTTSKIATLSFHKDAVLSIHMEEKYMVIDPIFLLV